MSIPKPPATPKGQEPPMYIQRPSSGHSQSVHHILAKAFRELYTRDPIRLDTVNNLQVSKGSDDPYHDDYVEKLQEVYAEWQQRMNEIAMLERHIMQAQAKSMSAEERELNKATMSCDNFKELGLPPVRSQFRSCIDTQLLHDHNLLAPSDYLMPDPLPMPAPKEPEIPAYARETESFRRHSRLDVIKAKASSGHKTAERLEGEMCLSDRDSQQGDTCKQDESQGNKIKFPPKHQWKEFLTEEQREADKKFLDILHSKTNYLRNPRHMSPPLSGMVLATLKACDKTKKQNHADLERQRSEARVVGFQPIPAIVEFNNYKIGEVYEIILELRNMSSVMQQCRALPPSSNAFSVGLGQFPGDSGLVAPGMSCTYGIRFTPHSLRNYDDSITIQMHGTDPLVIPLKARRPAPVLTIPQEIDIGSCLVGGVLSVHLLVKNEGGHGRFCLMSKTKWPTTSIRSVVPNVMKLTIRHPPFEIYPATFELDPGQSVCMEVVFNPQNEKSFVQEMVIVCDNCNVANFKLKGEGEIARISLDDVEMGLSMPVVGEYVDVSAKNLVKFEDLNPFTYTERVVKLSNCTKTELNYQWIIYKPILTSCFSDGQPGNVFEEERVPDPKSSFNVYPSNGVLQPSQSADFRLTFAPGATGNFHSVAHMRLLNVQPHWQSMPVSPRKCTIFSPEGLPNEDNYAILDQAVTIKDVTVMALEMTGKCIPLNVVLHPYALIIQAPVLKGSTVKKMFTMANHSYSNITFRWESYTESYFIEIEPPYGDLEPGMAMDFDISITGVKVGKITHTILCHILNMDEPLHFLVQADIKGPELKIEQPSINFGLIRVGHWETREMAITNTSEVVVKCTVFDSPVDQESQVPEAQRELAFSETLCELQPFERRLITVTMTPTAAGSIRRVCHVQYEGDKTCSIGVYGEAQNPVVCFLECQQYLPEVYLGVPAIFTVILHNQTLLPTFFKWGKAEGSECGDCQIDVLEPEGEILSWQQKSVSISFTALKAMSFSDVMLPCHIAGQNDDIYITIDCDVQELAVSFKVSTDGQQLTDNLQLEFGDSVGLSEIVKRYVHICNLTAITAPFSAAVENFPAPLVPHPEINDTDKITSETHIHLTRTPNVIGPQRKTVEKIKQEYNKMVLSTGEGAAFVVYPSSGQLQPFGTQVIEISAHSDLWGHYHDVLVCQVGNLQEVEIPVNLNVIGCPLSFQITGGLPGKEGTVRFGSHITGARPITRKLKINNSSPNDIRVDWQVFKRDESSDKLVDLITFYGKAFPKFDIFGIEVVPAYEITVFNTNEALTRYSWSAPRHSLRSIDNPTLELENELRGLPISKRVNIVSCLLQPHNGTKIGSPFSMKPSQMVIPAKGSGVADFTFTPFPASDVSEEMNFNGYALGFLNLDLEDEDSEAVIRAEGYSAEPININFSAQLKPPLLTVEELGEDGMRFSAAISDVLKDNEVQKEFLHFCSIKLTNNNLTPLTFKLKVHKPFLLVDHQGAENRAMDILFYKLKPRHSAVSQVAFCVSLSLLPKASTTGVSSSIDLIKKKLNFEDVLIIEFGNGVMQRVPLYATVTLSQIEVSENYLDFGVCLVGQTRELQFQIFNKTASHSSWLISFGNKSINCDDDTFQVQPQKGMLEAQVAYTGKSRALVKVYFTAKHSDAYDCNLVVQGLLGEESRRILVVGSGSYDGRHQAILNV